MGQDELLEAFMKIQEEETLKRVNESLKKDFDGSRRRYADRVSTSEALRNRRIKYLAQKNGHA